MARVPYEQRSVLLALETYLTGKGWTGITYTDAYQSDETITNPQVVVTFPPSTVKELQLGKLENGDKLFNRRVQVNAYMESERRAQAIADDIMDFMDETCIDIIEPDGDNVGYLLCSNSEAIRAETFAPILNMPKLLRWRAAVQGPFDAFYPGVSVGLIGYINPITATPEAIVNAILAANFPGTYPSPVLATPETIVLALQAAGYIIGVLVATSATAEDICNTLISAGLMEGL